MDTGSPVLLSIDLGTSTGWAVERVVSPLPRWGYWKLPRKDNLDRVGARIAVLDNTLTEFLDDLDARGQKPRWCVMAEPFMSRTLDETESSFGLSGIVRAEMWRRQIRVIRQPEATVRKETLGKGRAPTDEMKALAIGWCEQRGISILDHNAADAIILWRWTRDELVRQRRIAA